MKKIKILILLTLIAITSIFITNANVNASGNIGFRVTAKMNESSNLSVNDFVALGGPDGMGFTLDLYLTALDQDRSLTTIQTNISYDETLFENNVQDSPTAHGIKQGTGPRDPISKFNLTAVDFNQVIMVSNDPIKFMKDVETKVLTIPFWSTIDADFSSVSYTEI